MKPKLTIIFLIFFSTIYSQNIVVDVTDKLEESNENPAHSFKIIEPIVDTLNLTKEKVFALTIGHNGVLNSLHLIDYPTETYADLNKLERPKTNKEYDELSDEDWAKFNVIIPKHEISKEGVLSNKIIII